MKKISKRIVSLVCCVLMIFSCGIMEAFADYEYEQEGPPNVREGKGCILNTTVFMEYSEDSVNWLACDDGKTLVSPGRYYVRYKEYIDGNIYHIASDLEFVEVTEPAELIEDEKSEYGLWIGGVPVTSGAYSGSGWSYDSSANKLVLSGASVSAGTVSDKGVAGIFYNGSKDLIIEISGNDNKIKAPSSDCGADSFGIANISGKKISFSGNGSLSAASGNTTENGTSSFALFSSGDVEISGNVKIKAESGNAKNGSYGVFVQSSDGNGKANLILNGALEASSGSAEGIVKDGASNIGNAGNSLSAAVLAEDIYVAEGNSELKASAGAAAVSVGVLADNVYIYGGTVDASASEWSSGNGIRANVAISGEAVVSAAGTAGAFAAMPFFVNYSPAVSADGINAAGNDAQQQELYVQHRSVSISPMEEIIIPETTGEILPEGNIQIENIETEEITPEILPEPEIIDVPEQFVLQDQITETIPEQELFFSNEEPEPVLPQPKKVETIEIPAEFTLNEYESSSAALPVTINPSDADSRDVLWSITGTDITIDMYTGIITAGAAGTSGYVYAWATDDSGVYSNPCLVTVNKITKPVEAIEIPAEFSLDEYTSSTAALPVTITPADATTQAVLWAIDGTGVTIDQETGIITAEAGGSEGYVYAWATDGSGKYSNACHVTVNKTSKPVETIEIPAEFSLDEYTSSTSALPVTITPADASTQKVLWSVDGTGVTIDQETGIITAEAGGSEGYVYAWATDGSGKYSNACHVTVNEVFKPVESIAIPKSITLEAGETMQLEANVLPADASNPNVKWIIPEGSDITIDPATGIVTAGAGGNMTYAFAESIDGTKLRSNFCEIRVNKKVVPVSGISVSPDVASIMVGGKASAVITLTPAEASQDYEAESTNTAILTVNKNGNILIVEGAAKGEASVIITSKENPSVKTEMKVVVSEPISQVESISMVLDSDNIEPGKTTTARVTVKPDHATDKSFLALSSDPKVAEVPSEPITGNSFEIRGVGEGQATIRVLCASDITKNYEYTITVAKAVVPVKGISAIPENSKIKIGETSTAAVTILPADATDRSYLVSSSNSAIVSVPEGPQDGASFRFTGNAKGNATVTVKSVSNPDKTYAFSVSVEPGTVPVSEISVETKAVSLKSKGSYQDVAVKALPENATNPQMTVSVADTSVANLSSVNGKLRINAVGQGSTTVKLAANDGSGITNTIVVNVGGITPVTGVTLYNASGNITNAETITSRLGTKKLYAFVTPSTATDTGVTWASSNPYVAYVTPVDGQFNTAVVTGYGNGTAVITATANDGSGVRAQCIVTVSEGAAANYSITYKDNSGTWYYDYPTTFTVKCSGPLSNFFAAAIDGTVLNNAYYSRTGDNSSTTVVLSAACMQTLAPGKHTLTMYYNNGQSSASTYIFVQSVKDTPRTGDESMRMQEIAFILSAMGIFAGAYVSVKRKKEH